MFNKYNLGMSEQHILLLFYFNQLKMKDAPMAETS